MVEKDGKGKFTFLQAENISTTWEIHERKEEAHGVEARVPSPVVDENVKRRKNTTGGEIIETFTEIYENFHPEYS